MSVLFNLFKYVCAILDRFVFEPLFYFIIASISLGLLNIQNARDGNIYPSRKSLYLQGSIMIIVGIVLLWYYWLKAYPSSLLRV